MRTSLSSTSERREAAAGVRRGVSGDLADSPDSADSADSAWPPTPYSGVGRNHQAKTRACPPELPRRRLETRRDATSSFVPESRVPGRPPVGRDETRRDEVSRAKRLSLYVSKAILYRSAARPALTDGTFTDAVLDVRQKPSGCTEMRFDKNAL